MSRMNQKGPIYAETKIDNSRLQSLRRETNYSDGLVHLGGYGHTYDLYTMRLLPLFPHSLYVRRHVESFLDKGIIDLSRNIHLPECPGNEPVFRIVEEFCYGVMGENDISISNARKLMATSNYLEMESLSCRVWKFLRENVFISWKKCLDMLATFEYYTSGRGVNEDRLFERCIMAFVSNVVVHELISDYSSERVSTRRCSVEGLRAALALPPYVAECIYQHCRTNQFGLAYCLPGSDADASDYITGRSCLQIPLCTHFTGDPKNEDGLVTRFYPVAGSTTHGLKWIELVKRLVPEWKKRSSLILHLAESMHLENDITVPTRRRTICRSRVNWSFLCALLIEATELRSEKPQKKSDVAIQLDKEIGNLGRLVSQGLSAGTRWKFAKPSVHDQSGTELEEAKKAVELEESGLSDLRLILGFQFKTLLSVVTNFRDLSLDHLTIRSVGGFLDVCLSVHLKKKTFTLQQALLIYKEFPNNSRSSHEGMYHVFEDSLGRGAFSPEEVLVLTKLLDYDKLSDEIVEKLFIQLQCASCDPRLQKRFMEMLHMTQSDKDKSGTELIELRNKLHEQTADFRKVQIEKDNKEEELIQLLVQLRNELHFQAKDMTKVRNELSVQSADLIKVTQDRQLAERNLEDVKLDLEAEKEKTSCQICFTRPRDTLSLPCMHFLYCSDCLQQHHQRSKTCPTCRASTTGVLKCLLIV